MIYHNMYKFISFSGNHTIAVIKGKEAHGTLKESLSSVITDVNHLNDQGNIVVDGICIKVGVLPGRRLQGKESYMVQV